MCGFIPCRAVFASFELEDLKCLPSLFSPCYGLEPRCRIVKSRCQVSSAHPPSFGHQM